MKVFWRKSDILIIAFGECCICVFAFLRLCVFAFAPSATGEADRQPTFAMNLLGDYGGGAMPLALGMVAGLLQAQRTGKGDVIDAAICDGTNTLMTHIQSRRAMGIWQDAREANHLDGGTPWYGVYECADGKWISIAAIEAKFWDCLVAKLGYQPDDFGDRLDKVTWPATRAKLCDTFKSQPREFWDALLAGTDACYAPVLSPAEAHTHPQMAARDSFFAGTDDHPKPSPRFASQRPSPVHLPPYSRASRLGLHHSASLFEFGTTPTLTILLQTTNSFDFSQFSFL